MNDKQTLSLALTACLVSVVSLLMVLLRPTPAGVLSKSDRMTISELQEELARTKAAHDQLLTATKDANAQSAAIKKDWERVKSDLAAAIQAQADLAKKADASLSELAKSSGVVSRGGVAGWIMLEQGMTKAQVKALIGVPIDITADDSFEHWFYSPKPESPLYYTYAAHAKFYQGKLEAWKQSPDKR